MVIKIKNIDELREYLGTFLNGDDFKYALAAVENEFFRGLEWVPAKNKPVFLIQKLILQGDGVYNRAVDGQQYRITITKGQPDVLVARRTAAGVSVCPGWFGRIKKNIRICGGHYNESKIDKLFVGVNQFAQYIKSQ